jgi:hypothetical protein
MVTKLVAGLAVLASSSALWAQDVYYGWTPGSEIAGQRVQVQTNGITNTIAFENGGTAKIYSPSGSTVVDATWTANNGQLCLTTSGTFDCYPYRSPFLAGQPVDLISDCAVHSRWLAPQVSARSGERG